MNRVARLILCGLLVASYGFGQKSPENSKDSPTPPASSEASERRISAKLPKGSKEGSVIVWCVIDEKGKVTQAKVHRSLSKQADANALKAVKSWKFQPAMKDGRPVMVQVLVEVRFKNTEP